MSVNQHPTWTVTGDDLAEGVRLITINNPPVNALSIALCTELLAAVREADTDPKVTTVVFTGSGGNFSGGADVNDFNRADLDQTKTVTIRTVIAAVERSDKVYVAAIDGNALGGGLELALACDYRVATVRSRAGLPEIKLGLLPGAGGTQRLPRLIGANDALQIMLKGDLIKAEEAKAKGILDEVVAENAVDAAKAFAGKPKRRVSQIAPRLGVGNMGLFAAPFIVAQAHKMVPPEDNGGYAAHKLIDAVEASIQLPFERGLAREGRLFFELVQSAPSAALRHVFFAERELAKIPGLPPAEPLEIKTAGVIGAGTMGTGIAITFASVGIPVTVVETNDEQIDRSKEMVFGNFSYQVKKGRISQEDAFKKAQLVSYTSDYAELKDVDVVVEAAFESMAVKKEIFGKLDAICKPEAILASNTSTLDIDAIAAQTKRPEKVVGMHFFAPANIMKLLEIVRGKASSPQTLVTALKLGRTLKKVAVVAGNEFGFIGNRTFFDYTREAMTLALEGATPWRVDRVMKKAGMAMGPFATSDLSGVDVFWRIEQERDPKEFGDKSYVVDQLYQQKRWGQKTGGGFFDYEKGKRDPIRSEAVEALFAEEAKQRGIRQRGDEITDDEIINRLWLALANQGAILLERGVALRPGDIDIVFIYGYGFPPHHGGPMWYVEEIGTQKAAELIASYRARYGDVWTPAAMFSKELTHA